SGLEFRITAAGARSWSFRFRDVAGKQTRATIGEYPAIGLKAARTAADAMRARVAVGGNPVEEKRAARRGANGQTFEALAARNLTEHAERHKRSHKRDARNLDLHVLPRWQGRRFATIRRGDVIELVERLIAAGKPTLANRVQSLISSIFTFGMDAAVVEANPAIGCASAVSRMLAGGFSLMTKSSCLGQALSIGRALGKAASVYGWRSCARVGEVAGICRGELERLGEPDRAAWIIPGA